LDALSDVQNEAKIEILFADNRSGDRSWLIINQMSKRFSEVKGIRYSRNFGYQRSILQAHLVCSGDCAVTLDCDLQDNPALIEKFWNEWKRGAKIVYGVRKTRKENAILSFARRAYYRLLARLSEINLPIDVGEFRLVDRCIIEHLREYQDHQPYLRGIIASLGYEPKYIEYDRDRRDKGHSKFNLRELLKLASDGIFDFSTLPLRAALYLGMIIFVCTIIGALGYLVARILIGDSWPSGFMTITMLLLIGIGMNGIFLGIIGEYIGRIYKQLKRGPVAIISQSTDSTFKYRLTRQLDSSSFSRPHSNYESLL
jgi:dolichol-phosphate mannosyltransferase